MVETIFMKEFLNKMVYLLKKEVLFFYKKMHMTSFKAGIISIGLDGSRRALDLGSWFSH